ncbi:MAG: ABC transporter substrate binding protein [bacterium JZ-2024 1]
MCFAVPARSITVVYRPGGKIFEAYLKGFKEGWGKPIREITEVRPEIPASEYRDSEGLIIVGSSLWESISPILKDERLAPIQVLSCVLDKPRNQPMPDWTIDLRVPPAEWGTRLLQVAPYVKSVGVVVTKEAREHPLLGDAEKWLKEKKVRLVTMTVESHREVVHVFRERLRDFQAVWLFPDAPVLGRVEVVDFILETSLSNGIIVVGPSGYYTQRGALISVEPDYYALGRETAAVLKRRQADPEAPMSFSSPPRFVLTLNRRTAYALRITLPKALLDSAGSVF